MDKANPSPKALVAILTALFILVGIAHALAPKDPLKKALGPQRDISMWSLRIVDGDSIGNSIMDWSQLWDIGECESDCNQNVCNKQYGCYAGIGYWMIIPSTAKYCSNKIGRGIDPYKAEDNFECAVWLLDNEGDRHWNQSKHCWAK